MELQLLAYTTITQDLSHVCDLHCSLQQCQNLNPLSEAREQTHILMGIKLGSSSTEPQRELLLTVLAMIAPFAFHRKTESSCQFTPKNC